ncbi:hypothetical protein ACYZFV_01390 [Serratia ureilytica]
MTELRLNDIKMFVTVDLEHAGKKVEALRFATNGGFCDIDIVEGGATTVINALKCAIVEIEDKFGDKTH